MTTEQTQLVLLRDEDGILYAINRAQLQQFRIPEAVQATVDQPLAGTEVSGYSVGTGVPLVSFSWGAADPLSDLVKTMRHVGGTPPKTTLQD